MSRYLIKTENGYKEFLGVQKSKETDGLLITFDKCIIKCTKTHRIKKDGKFVQAKDLKVSDKIGEYTIISIQQVKDEFYDIFGVQGNTYTCNGLEHHNCNILVVDETAFLKTNIWNDFIDAMSPSQSALAWKKNIFLSTANGTNHFKDMFENAKKPKVYYDLPMDTEIQLDDGKVISLEEFYNSQF